MILSFVIFAMGVIGGCFGIQYIFQDKGRREWGVFFFAMGVMLACWCCGYGLMGVSPDEGFAESFRLIGLFGALGFLSAEIWFMARTAKNMTRHVMLAPVIIIILSAVDFVWFGLMTPLKFEKIAGRMCYTGELTTSRYYHYAVFICYVVLLLVLALSWRGRTNLRREKRIVNYLIGGFFLIALGSIYDSVLPAFGEYSVPLSGVGAFITFLVTYVAEVRYNAFSLSEANVGTYLYEDVETPVLIFDDQHKLLMANRSAKDFFGVDHARGKELSDLFAITDDMKSEIEELLKNGGQGQKQLTSINDRKLCAVNFSQITDHYGEPYCNLAVIYDLSREKKMMEQLNMVKARLEVQLSSKERQVEEMNLQAIATIARIIDSRDEYTKGHSQRVAAYCECMAKAMNWSEQEIQNLKCVALLHDIGKIGVPDSVMSKPGSLSEIEYKLIQEHTAIGDSIVKDISMISHIREGVRSHHERWDGTGYPDGLAAEAIPVYAQVIGIADSYDAMNTLRVYHKKLSKEEIIAELEKGKGVQFSPYFLGIFLSLVKNGKLEVTEAMLPVENMTDGAKLFERVAKNYYSDSGMERDYLTGLWGREACEKLVTAILKDQAGYMVCLDMDNLKVVNDIHGHTAGDLALKTLAETLENQAHECVYARVGGDEFLLFVPDEGREELLRIIDGVFGEFKEHTENNELISKASISAGISYVQKENSYREAYDKADKALYHVKQNGKGGYYFYSEDSDSSEGTGAVNLEGLMGSLQNIGHSHGAFNVSYRDFAQLYSLVGNMAKRYNYALQIMLITAAPRAGETFTIEQQELVMYHLQEAVIESLRSVDVGTRHGALQFLLILTDAHKENVSDIAERIFRRFEKMYSGKSVVLTYDTAEYHEEKKA